MKMVQRNERGFAYVQFQGGSHDHVRTRLWIHEGCLTKDGEEVTCPFPAKNAEVKKTEKGTFVMKPGSGTVVYADIVSGYRGSARIDEVRGGEIVFSGASYHSGQGALGETAWALINGTGPHVEVFGTRTGRRVDNSAVAFRLTADGEKEELVDDKEVCELLA